MAVRTGGRVFISYRREDAAGHAGRVHDRLAHELGPDLLFMDVDAIPLGVNFVKELENRLAFCDALVAVIGPDWLNVRDKEGRRRLDNPNDFVRVEIASALQRGILVIPIFLEGATVPSADQLPTDLQELPLRNGINVRHSSFHSDMDRLVRGLRGKWHPPDWRVVFASSAIPSQNHVESTDKQEALLKSFFERERFEWVKRVGNWGAIVLLVGLVCWVMIEPSLFSLGSFVLVSLIWGLWWWRGRPTFPLSSSVLRSRLATASRKPVPGKPARDQGARPAVGECV
jgi:hypothetical protein